MREFLMVLKGDGMNHMSPDELQQIFTEYKAWMTQLGDQYVTGQRLEEGGSLLHGKEAPILTDGPFLEPKEIIAGFMIIKAESQEDANQLVATCPHLGPYTIEVRPIVFPPMA